MESGYSNKMTVTKGEEIIFYISTKVNPFSLSIYKRDQQLHLIQIIDGIEGAAQGIGDSSYWYGCQWNETYRFIIPESWQPGVYKARFPVSNGTREILFFVREPVPGTHSNILMVINQNTWNAYNNFGGKSIYDNRSSNNVRSYKVSFLRPSAAADGFPDYNFLEDKLISWAYSNNINMEFAVNYDVYANPDLLSNYDLVITAGHSEYWSRPERLQFENYISNGGKVMILSGNTCWWQVRYEDNGNTMVCYKDQFADPLNGVADSLVTVSWSSPPLNYPENILTGVSYRNAGYVNVNGLLMASEGYGDYAAYNTHHWVYRGTNLKEGKEFGYSTTIVGYETDGALFNWVSGVPVVTGTDMTPKNFRILGISPATNDGAMRFATMGIYHTKNGGALFNASTVDWVEGLGLDPAVTKITTNVISKFLADRFPPEIVSWSPSFVKNVTINNQPMQVNERYIELSINATFTFSVYAEDPYGEQKNYQWLVNDIPAGNDSFLVFNNNNPDERNYIITALVFNSKDTSEINWQVLNTGALPEAPQPAELISPQNTSIDISLAFTFEWSNVSRASRYIFEISEDSSFTNLFFRNDQLTENFYFFPQLNSNTKYYWRIKSINNDGESDWSEVWSFTTVTQFLISTMNGTLTGDAKLGNKTGSISARPLYFEGMNGGAYYTINIPETGTYYLWARLFYYSSGGKNSFFINGSGNKFILGDDDGKYNVWHWDGSNGRKINLGVLDEGQHTIIITAREPGLTLWVDQLLVTNDRNFLPEGFILKSSEDALPEPPSPPVLLMPENNQVDMPLEVTFKWGKLIGVQSYAFQLSADSSFENIFSADSSITDTVITAASLSFNTKYWWRLKSRNSGFESDWSVARSFTTVSSEDEVKYRILISAMDGIFAGDAKLGNKTGSLSAKPLYFQGMAGSASYNINIPKTGTYYVWARMFYYSTGEKNSFYINGNGNKFVLGDDDGKYNVWHWDGSNGSRINLGVLNKGQNTLVITAREPGLTLWVDQLLVTNDRNFLPEGFILKSDEDALPEPPSPPVLVLPADNQLDLPLAVSFKWEKVPGAQNFIFQLSTDSLFNNIIARDSLLTDTVKTIDSLSFNTKYSWRIKVRKSGVESDWSVARSFTTVSSEDEVKYRILISAMDGIFAGDAKLGNKTGSLSAKPLYFQGMAGSASYNINIPKTGTYYVWARMFYYSTGEKNSFYINGNGNKFVLGDDDGKYNVWHWDGSNGSRINLGVLNKGQNTLVITAREPGLTLWVDQLLVTNDRNFLPEGFILKSDEDAIADAPSAPEKLSPINNQMNTLTEITFKWGKSIGAQKYIFQLSGDSLFNTILIADSALTDTTITISSLQYSTEYWWRVRGVNLSAESGWSNYNKFTTGNSDDPPVLVLINAINGTRTGDAKLGSKSGMKNSRAVYFSGTNGGVSFTVDLPKTTVYYAWARMFYYSSGGLNSFFFNFNGNQFILGDDDSKYDIWHWDGYSATGINLGSINAGAVTFSISGREPGLTLWVDQILITDDPFYNPNLHLGKTSAGSFISNAVPDEFNLLQNFPNPFNPSTTIKYALPQDGMVSMILYNSLGSKVASLVDEFKTAGYYDYRLDANEAEFSLSSGIYFIVLKAGNSTKIRKIVLLK